MKAAQSLQEFYLPIKCVSEAIKNKAKKQKRNNKKVDFLVCC